jgi:hypothetical protein
MLYVMAYAPEESREGDYPQLEDMTGAELDMVYEDGDWEFGEPVRHQHEDPEQFSLLTERNCSAPT